MWFFLALLAAGIYAIAETIDNFFVNREFRHPLVLVFYSSLFNLIYVPVYFYFTNPTLPPVSTYPLFFLLGLMSVGYLWPYYKGLQEDDTSIAISFLAIERVFVPVLAFFIVGEFLAPTQYIGILVIIVSVILLGLHHSKKKFKINKSVWHISWAALFLAGEAILLKVLFDQGVPVSTAVIGEALMSLVFGVSIIGFTKVRRNIIASVPLFIKMLPIFFIEELFTFLGLVTESNAISKTSVSVVKGITMTAPFFLVIYAWLGYKMFPKVFKEDLHRKKVIRKLLLFALLIVGIMLVKE